MLFANEAVNENGEPLGGLGYVLGALLAVIALSWIIFSIMALCLCFKNKGQAFEITDRGVSNALLSGRLASIMLCARVSLIPWEAVKSYSKHDNNIIMDIDVSEIECNFLAKYLLRNGYYFAHNMIKEKLSDEEISFIEGHLYGKEDKDLEEQD